MYGYIYKTTNLINNKQYIGKHKSSIFDNNYKGSGRLLKQAIKKYGLSNFKCELIEECKSKNDLNEKEIKWIKLYNAVEDPNFYNLDLGGSGEGAWYHLSDEQKIQFINKQTLRWSGKYNPHYGVHKNFGSGMKGKHHTEESKLKMSISRKGRKLAPKEAYTNSLKARQYKVQNLSTGEVFGSLDDANKFYNTQSIRAAINAGKGHKAVGYYWIRLDKDHPLGYNNQEREHLLKEYDEISYQIYQRKVMNIKKARLNVRRKNNQ